MGIATASCGDHTACGHASHCGFGHVEDSGLGGGFEDAINFGDALGEGADGLVWGVCALGVAFAVSWEVDGDDFGGVIEEMRDSFECADGG